MRAIRFALTLLLAGWLGLAQIAVAAHDATHHLHAHADLCDILSGHGNGPALTTHVATPALPPAIASLGNPLVVIPAQPVPYPAFHSRAPPR